jgi:hypothetical protein
LSQRSRRSFSSIGFGSAKTGGAILAGLLGRSTERLRLTKYWLEKWQNLTKTTDDFDTTWLVAFRWRLVGKFI